MAHDGPLVLLDWLIEGILQVSVQPIGIYIYGIMVPSRLLFPFQKDITDPNSAKTSHAWRIREGTRSHWRGTCLLPWLCPHRERSVRPWQARKGQSPPQAPKAKPSIDGKASCPSIASCVETPFSASAMSKRPTASARCMCSGRCGYRQVDVALVFKNQAGLCMNEHLSVICYMCQNFWAIHRAFRMSIQIQENQRWAVACRDKLCVYRYCLHINFKLRLGVSNIF